MPGPRLNARPVLVLMALLSVPAQFQPSAAQAQTEPSLPAKEALYYNVEWRMVDAGKVKLTWGASSQPSRPGWQIKLHLESAGLVSKLYRVDDEYSADLNSGLCAENTHTQALEGGRHRDTLVHFDPVAKKASFLEHDLVRHTTLSLETDIPSCVYDVVGALFILRTKSIEPGKSIEVPVSDGKKSVSAKVEAQQREQIKVPAGTFKTIRYEAYLFNGVLYRRPAHLYLWLTDDSRKLPVRIQVRLHFTIGTITLQLEKEDKT